MPISVLTKKGQTTIPVKVRKALNLKPKDKIVYLVEGDHALIKPLKGGKTILDYGGAFGSKVKEKPIDFKKVREETQKTVAKHIIEEMKG